MSPIRPFPILLQPLLLVEPFDFAARDHRREPACGDQHAERDDEERQVEVGDRISSDDRPEQCSREDDDDDREDEGNAVGEQHPQHYAREGQHAAEREVEPAAQHREGQADAHDQQDRAAVENVPEVRDREEARLVDREEGDQDQQDGGDAEIAEQRLPEAASSRASSPYLRHFRPCRRRSATRFARPTPRPAATRPRAAARA